MKWKCEMTWITSDIIGGPLTTFKNCMHLQKIVLQKSQHKAKIWETLFISTK